MGGFPAKPGAPEAGALRRRVPPPALSPRYRSEFNPQEFPVGCERCPECDVAIIATYVGDKSPRKHGGDKENDAEGYRFPGAAHTSIVPCEGGHPAKARPCSRKIN